MIKEMLLRITPRPVKPNAFIHSFAVYNLAIYSCAIFSISTNLL